MAPLLVIGNKNISSWSMRAFLALHEKGVAFDERVVDLADPARQKELAEISPSGRVPVLIDGDRVVFDSLAIMEYVDEAFAGPALHPRDVGQRARSRSLLAWMHAGFLDLRAGVPFERTFSGRALTAPEAAIRDAERLLAIWDRELAQSGGPYLVGACSLADLTFAPVLRRLSACGFSLAPRPRVLRWAAALMDRPSVRAWMTAAEALPPFTGQAEL